MSRLVWLDGGAREQIEALDLDIMNALPVQECTSLCIFAPFLFSFATRTSALRYKALQYGSVTDQ